MTFEIGKMFTELLKAGGLEAVEMEAGKEAVDYSKENTVFFTAPTLEVTALNVNGFHNTVIPVFVWLSDEFDKSSFDVDIFDHLVHSLAGRSMQGKGFRLKFLGFKDRTVHAPGKFEVLWNFIAKDYDTEDETVPAEKRARVVGVAPQMAPPKKK